jgi:hypothetical protein
MQLLYRLSAVPPRELREKTVKILISFMKEVLRQAAFTRIDTSLFLIKTPYFTGFIRV